MNIFSPSQLCAGKPLKFWGSNFFTKTLQIYTGWFLRREQQFMFYCQYQLTRVFHFDQTAQSEICRLPPPQLAHFSPAARYGRKHGSELGWRCRAARQGSETGLQGGVARHGSEAQQQDTESRHSSKAQHQVIVAMQIIKVGQQGSVTRPASKA